MTLRFKGPLLCFGLCVLGLAAVVPASAEEWNQWRGPKRNGTAESSPPLLASLPAEGLKPLWMSERIPSGSAGGWGSPVVADGKVYLFTHVREKKPESTEPKRQYPWIAPDKKGNMTDAEYAEYEKKRREEDLQIATRFFQFHEDVLCLDAATGKELWKVTKPSVYSRFVQSGSPAVVDGKLYVLGAGRMARCFDAETGAEIWETRLPGEFLDEFMMSSFAIASTKVDNVSRRVAVVLAGHLFGLDAESGKILWEGDPTKTSGTHTSPVVWESGGQEYVIVNVAGADTILIDPATGKERWRTKTEGNLSTPVISGARMVTLGNSRKKGLRCYEITPDAAKHLWTYTGVADKGSSPVIVGDYVYAQGERRLACVDLKTGDEAWRGTLELRNPQYTSLIAADGKVFYAHDGLLCFQADPKEYKPILQAKVDQSGLMAPEQTFRKLLDLDQLEKAPDGQQKALKLYEQKVGNHGPLDCSSPAIADGKLYVRLKSAIACYDLSASPGRSAN